MTKIRNSWLQRAIILLRKRFPVALVLNDFKVWNKQYTTRIVSFCSRKKWCLLQVDTRFVNLMQMMYLLFAISIRLQAVTESFCLKDEGKILCKRKRMLYRAVAWPQKMRMYYQSGISLNLRTGPAGHATLFNQWEGALVFISKQIKTSPQCSKIFKTTDRVDGQH